MDEAALEAALCSVRGIGLWTCHMHAMFHLGSPDVLPTGDLGVRKGMAQLSVRTQGKRSVHGRCTWCTAAGSAAAAARELSSGSHPTAPASAALHGSRQCA